MNRPSENVAESGQRRQESEAARFEAERERDLLIEAAEDLLGAYIGSRSPTIVALRVTVDQVKASIAERQNATTVSPWRSGVPAQRVLVLVAVPEIGMATRVREATWDGERWDMAGGPRWPDQVSGWMPLPSPPGF